MKKNTSKDYFEEEIEETEEIVASAMERADEIDELLQNRPKKGVGEVEWKRRVNGLIVDYNKDFGNAYNKVR